MPKVPFQSKFNVPESKRKGRLDDVWIKAIRTDESFDYEMTIRQLRKRGYKHQTGIGYCLRVSKDDLDSALEEESEWMATFNLEAEVIDSLSAKWQEKYPEAPSREEIW